MTSPPNWENKKISIAVKAMPEGFLSSHLVSGAVPSGTIVRLATPAGNFALPDPPPEKILFITAGSGITPVMGMLRTMNRRGQLPDVMHVHSAPTESDVMFADELTALHGEHEDFVSHIQLTRRDGKFKLSSLDQVCPDWRERHTWACGPLPLLDEIDDVWKAEGSKTACTWSGSRCRGSMRPQTVAPSRSRSRERPSQWTVRQPFSKLGSNLAP